MWTFKNGKNCSIWFIQHMWGSEDTDAGGFGASVLENDRCEHRKSNIGKIGRHPGHRTSDCYMAPIPMFGGWSHSAARRVSSACLPTLGSVYTILQPAGRQCGGAVAAKFRTADYYAAGRTPTKMQPAPVCSQRSLCSSVNIKWFV